MKNVRYIGKKDQKADNVAGTGIVWNGPSDVQQVPDSAFAKLMQHPGVWEDAGADAVDGHATNTAETETNPQNTETEPSESATTVRVEDTVDVDSLPPMPNLDGMDKPALRDFAQRHFGHEFHHNAGEAKMRQAIIGLMNRG